MTLPSSTAASTDRSVDPGSRTPTAHRDMGKSCAWIAPIQRMALSGDSKSLCAILWLRSLRIGISLARI